MGLKRSVYLIKNSSAIDDLSNLENAYNSLNWETTQDLLNHEGIFTNKWSLEPTLIEDGYLGDIFSILTQLDLGPRISAKIKKIFESDQLDSRDIEYICKQIEDVGKGRVAQRLSSILHDQDAGSKPVPAYIDLCLKYLIGKLNASIESIESAAPTK